MNSIEKTNTSARDKSKMTLRDYFNSLPRRDTVAPRKELINDVATKCNVSASAARSWLAYGICPKRYKHLVILSELTGIPIDNLFEGQSAIKD